MFKLNDEELKVIEHEKCNYENIRAVSIEALKIVQKQRGWISNEAISAIANELHVLESDIEEIATFYNQIFRRPVGRNIIYYCDSIVCYINNYQNIQNTIEKELNIKSGQTTLDNRFTLLPICCLGKCDKAPAIMINEDTHAQLTSETVKKLLEQYQ